MTEPQNFREVCALISARTKPTRAPDLEWEESVQKEFDACKARYKFMAKSTLKNYFHLEAATHSQEKQIKLNQPNYSARKIWDAVYQLQSWATTPLGPGTWYDFLDSGKFSPIPLGKLHGIHKMYLIPAVRALPVSVVEEEPTLSYADHDFLAISYPDGHPSEDEWSEKTLVVKSGKEDQKLRRLVSLGWLAQLDDGMWTKTGHVLVADMEAGRDCQPWIVLASKWPNDTGEVDESGDDYIYAPALAVRGDSTQVGVLPDDKTRTPVARLESLHKNFQGSVLRSFGPEFEFRAVKTGSSRGYDPRTPRGPGLARIMVWFMDTDSSDEICFTEYGEEYMRYKRDTNRVVYSEVAKGSFAGEEGMLGQIVDEDRGFVSLEQRPWSVGIGGPSQQPLIRRREVSSSSGFS